MRYRVFLSSEPFLTQVRLYRLGCVTNTITSLLFLGGIWWLSDSVLAFFNLLQAQLGRIISISTFLVVIYSLFLVLDIDMIKSYLFLPPTTSRIYGNLSGRIEKKVVFGYAIPVGVAIITVVTFLVGYFVANERWDLLLRNIFLSFIPIPIAFVAINLAGIVIHFGLLVLGYVIQRSRLE